MTITIMVAICWAIVVVSRLVNHDVNCVANNVTLITATVLFVALGKGVGLEEPGQVAGQRGRGVLATAVWL